MNIYELNKVYCIGIGGIGVSAVAKFFSLNGAQVSGSDLVESENLDELRTLGIKIFIGHNANNISEDVELVIHSPAVTVQNQEYIEAKKRNLKIMSYPELLGEISKTRPTIAITGMHGKSTTTAMTGILFESFDPLVIVGSKVPGFNYGNLRYTKSKISPFIVEACEYRGHMRLLEPTDIIITNIEEEHLDYYKDIEHIKKTFQEFVSKLPETGRLYRNSSDKNEDDLKTKGRIISFGISKNADFRGYAGEFKNGSRKLAIELRGEPLGKIQLNVPGEHNIRNSLAAIACALSHNISLHEIAEQLKKFNGIWRRFERVGDFQGIIVHSDYGHHPTEILATLSSARELYPKQRIILVFQPHQYDRTKKLFNEFLPSLKSADLTIISDIYDVAGREEEKNITSLDLVNACALPKVTYSGNLENTLIAVKNAIKSHDDVVVIMGAGTIDWVARELVK